MSPLDELREELRQSERHWLGLVDKCPLKLERDYIRQNARSRSARLEAIEALIAERDELRKALVKIIENSTLGRWALCGLSKSEILAVHEARDAAMKGPE